MSGNNKYSLFNLFTIILLVAFVLIKANPFYYILQYTPDASVSHSRQAASLANNHRANNSLIKFDKSITESTDSKYVPAIKFTGIPFVLFFFGYTLPLFLYRQPGATLIYNFFKNEACIGKCILRL